MLFPGIAIAGQCAELLVEGLGTFLLVVPLIRATQVRQVRVVHGVGQVPLVGKGCFRWLGALDWKQGRGRVADLQVASKDLRGAAAFCIQLACCVQV
jgi:hypothetical protein